MSVRYKNKGIKNDSSIEEWWYPPVIPAFRRPRHEDCRSRPAWFLWFKCPLKACVLKAWLLVSWL
jgi:hypothetical protein